MKECTSSLNEYFQAEVTNSQFVTFSRVLLTRDWVLRLVAVVEEHGINSTMKFYAKIGIIVHLQAVIVHLSNHMHPLLALVTL